MLVIVVIGPWEIPLTDSIELPGSSRSGPTGVNDMPPTGERLRPASPWRCTNVASGDSPAGWQAGIRDRQSPSVARIREVNSQNGPHELAGGRPSL